MESSRDQQEFLPIEQLELHVESVAIHIAVEIQLVWSGPLEDKGSFPVLVVFFREFERVAFDIHVRSVTLQGIVHALKSHRVGNSKIARRQRSLSVTKGSRRLPVHRHFGDVPDAV